MLRNTLARLLATTSLAVAALAVLPGCSTNVQGDDASPVFFTVNFQDQILQKNVATGTPIQIPTVIVNMVFKNPTASATTFLEANLEDYTVEWRRLDKGTAVPQPEVFVAGVLVPAGGSSTL